MAACNPTSYASNACTGTGAEEERREEEEERLMSVRRAGKAVLVSCRWQRVGEGGMLWVEQSFFHINSVIHLCIHLCIHSCAYCIYEVSR